MLISQKAQYGLRATFELARHNTGRWIRVSEIAEAQAIPPRFLEVILNQLKQAGFVTSHRGSRGGYMLAGDPKELTVGQVLRFIEGPVGPVECVTDQPKERCPLRGGCPFLSLWERVQSAISNVYDSTTLQDLVDSQPSCGSRQILDYSI